MESDFDIHSWFTYNNYFKGNLDDLKLRNKGMISFYKTKIIPLYKNDGEFYKNEHEREFISKTDDIEIKPAYKEIVQIDYKFYLVPVPERLEIQEGRSQLERLFINYGITGLKYIRTFLQEKRHYTQHRVMYEVERPLEIYSRDEYRLNTKSFINFNYHNYIENYEQALIKYPDYKNEIDRLKNLNINIICDFYMITEKQLKHKNFNRLEHAIRVLNKKINNH